MPAEASPGHKLRMQLKALKLRRQIKQWKKEVKVLKKKIKLKKPASVAQGTEGADTLATEVGITERAIATGSKDKVAFVDVDITLASA